MIRARWLQPIALFRFRLGILSHYIESSLIRS